MHSIRQPDNQHLYTLYTQQSVQLLFALEQKISRWADFGVLEYLGKEMATHEYIRREKSLELIV